MIILGIDPGMERLGLGVVSVDPFELTHMGTIPNLKNHEIGWHDNLDAGIRNITDQFQRTLMIYDPKEIAAELVPPGKLGSRADTVRAAVTVCKTIAYLHGIPWTDYGANTIKETVTGDGTATKARVRNAILELFPKWMDKHQDEKRRQKKDGIKRPTGIPQDAFDGAAIAVTHIYKVHRDGEDTV